MIARAPEITALHTQVSALLRPLGRSPTGTEYASALALADRALELATGGGAAAVPDNPDDHVVQTCLTFQAFCVGPLRRAGARSDAREREAYDRASRAARRKRRGIVWDVDAGEHMFGAIEALNLEDWLGREEDSGDEEEDKEEEERRSSSPSTTKSGRNMKKKKKKKKKKKVRWLDEVSVKARECADRERVRLRDSRGGLTDPRQVPLLKKQVPRQFDGWKNVV